MPRLLVFAMCQKAITDKADASLSLISLIYGVEVSHPSEPLTQDAVTALTWSVACSWLKMPEDDGKTFEQRVQIMQPDGTAVGEATTTFKMAERSHQNTVNGTAFPVGQAGEYQMQLWFREVVEGDEWKLISEYPFEVRHVIGSSHDEQ